MIIGMHKDIVGYSFGGTKEFKELVVKSDWDAGACFTYYIKANDADTQLLKKAFYAVVLHGLPHAVFPTNMHPNEPKQAWGFRELGNEIRVPYSKDGKSRAILLLSCYSGYAIARPLARYLHLPVVAPRAVASVHSDGQIYTVFEQYGERNPSQPRTEDIKRQDYIVKNRMDWILCSQTGMIEIVPPGAAKLDKLAAVDLVKKYWTVFG